MTYDIRRTSPPPKCLGVAGGGKAWGVVEVGEGGGDGHDGHVPQQRVRQAGGEVQEVVHHQHRVEGIVHHAADPGARPPGVWSEPFPE